MLMLEGRGGRSDEAFWASRLSMARVQDLGNVPIGTSGFLTIFFCSNISPDMAALLWSTDLPRLLLLCSSLPAVVLPIYSSCADGGAGVSLPPNSCSSAPSSVFSAPLLHCCASASLQRLCFPAAPLLRGPQTFIRSGKGLLGLSSLQHFSGGDLQKRDI